MFSVNDIFWDFKCFTNIFSFYTIKGLINNKYSVLIIIDKFYRIYVEYESYEWRQKYVKTLGLLYQEKFGEVSILVHI